MSPFADIVTIEGIRKEWMRTAIFYKKRVFATVCSVGIIGTWYSKCAWIWSCFTFTQNNRVLTKNSVYWRWFYPKAPTHCRNPISYGGIIRSYISANGKSSNLGIWRNSIPSHIYTSTIITIYIIDCISIEEILCNESTRRDRHSYHPFSCRERLYCSWFFWTRDRS